MMMMVMVVAIAIGAMLMLMRFIATLWWFIFRWIGRSCRTRRHRERILELGKPSMRTIGENDIMIRYRRPNVLH
jgi:hypothetical protein